MAADQAPEASLRLFVAVLIPPEWQHYLAELETTLERRAPGYARWVRAELLHLTLVFLGYQRPARYDQIVAASREAAEQVRPFELSLGRLGGFGSGGRPRVVWVDVLDRKRGLQHLHRALVPALQARDINLDERPLVPHITLGRARREVSASAGRAIASALAELPLPRPRPAPFMVRWINLMRSELSREGPRYTELERFGLRESARYC